MKPVKRYSCIAFLCTLSILTSCKSNDFANKYQLTNSGEIEVSNLQAKTIKQIDCSEFLNVINTGESTKAKFVPHKEVLLVENNQTYKFYFSKTNKYFSDKWRLF